MNYYDVLVYSTTKTSSLFTYASHKVLHAGQVVRVPFRTSTLWGVVVNTASSYPRAKQITDASTYVIPLPLVKAVLAMVAHSGISHSGAAQLLLGSFSITKSRSSSNQDKTVTEEKIPTLPRMTPEQQRALEEISNSAKPALLLGITGSGKTRVYLEMIKEQLAHGRSAIVLSPEVGLGSQIAHEIARYFPKETLFVHSEQTPKERREAWMRCVQSAEPVVVVGPRSSLFLPVQNLGLIVLDELHDDSYKQSNDPRYHALHAASLLAKYSKARLVCGTASPNVADFYYFEKAEYPIISLTNKAKSGARPARISVIDMRQQKSTGLLAKQSIEHIRTAVDNGHQALIFFNRRGTSRMVACESCGFIETCSRCEYTLTLHRDTNMLVCHSCGLTKQPRSVCPECSSALRYSVPGIKQLELEVRALFPENTVVRFDSDNQKSQSLASSVQAIKEKLGTIIIGTQIIAKGLDLPLLETVVVVRAESALAIPDYRAEEKLFQQLYQLIGRVGRGHIADTNVILQTHTPESKSLQFAAKEDWHGFYDSELSFRQQLDLPPFKYLASIRVRRKTAAGVEKAAEKLADKIQAAYPTIRIIGPAPALIEKHPTYYEWTLQALSNKRSMLLQIQALLGGNEFLDVDPTQIF